MRTAADYICEIEKLQREVARLNAMVTYDCREKGVCPDVSELDQLRAENDRMREAIEAHISAFHPDSIFKKEIAELRARAFSPPAPQFEEVTVMRWGIYDEAGDFKCSLPCEPDQEIIDHEWPDCVAVPMTGKRRIPIPVKTKRREAIPRTAIIGASDFPKDAKFYCESWE